jgi:hypothetical protein
VWPQKWLLPPYAQQSGDHHDLRCGLCHFTRSSLETNTTKDVASAPLRGAAWRPLQLKIWPLPLYVEQPGENYDQRCGICHITLSAWRPLRLKIRPLPLQSQQPGDNYDQRWSLCHFTHYPVDHCNKRCGLCHLTRSSLETITTKYNHYD